MKFAQFLGLGILFSSLSLALAGGFGTPKKEDVPKYLKMLNAKIATDRAKAAEMLGKRGSVNANDVEDAVGPLKKLVQKDLDAKVRAAAVRALGDIRSDAEGVVPILIERVKMDSIKDVQMASVVALGQYGPAAKDALPTLREFAGKFDPKKMKQDFGTVQNAIAEISMKKKKKG